jgi:hypothetical protein
MQNFKGKARFKDLAHWTAFRKDLKAKLECIEQHKGYILVTFTWEEE